jgi:peptidyl-prolyl cis-trans isomerase C
MDCRFTSHLLRMRTLLFCCLVGIAAVPFVQAAEIDDYISKRQEIAKNSKARVLASVNGAPLTENDLHNSAVLRKLDPAKLTESQRSRMLGELVLEELVQQESLRKELHKQPVVIAQVAYAQRNILKQTLLNEYNRKHPVTDTEVEVFYKANKSRLAVLEFHPRHVLVKDKATAEKLIRDLDNGSDFARLAKKHSIDPSAGKGGDLGWVSLDSVDRQFGTAMRALKKGQYNKQPVQTRFGWHVILLEDLRSTPAPEYDKIKNKLKANLIAERLKQYLDELKNKAKIEIKK